MMVGWMLRCFIGFVFQHHFLRWTSERYFWSFPPVGGRHTGAGDFRTIGTSLAKTSTEFAQTRLADCQVIYFFQRSFRANARDTSGVESYRWDAHSILTLENHNLSIGSADPCGHGGGPDLWGPGTLGFQKRVGGFEDRAEPQETPKMGWGRDPCYPCPPIAPWRS